MAVNRHITGTAHQGGNYTAGKIPTATLGIFYKKVEKRQLWVRPFEWTYLECMRYSKNCTPLYYTTSPRSAIILVLAYQWVCGREKLPVSCDTRIRSMYLVRIIRVRTVPYTTYGTAVVVPKYARFLWYLVVYVLTCTRDFWSGHGPRARTRTNAHDYEHVILPVDHTYIPGTLLTAVSIMPSTIRMTTTRTYVTISMKCVRRIMHRIWHSCVENVHTIRMLCMMQWTGHKSGNVCDVVSHHVIYYLLQLVRIL